MVEQCKQAIAGESDCELSEKEGGAGEDTSNTPYSVQEISPYQLLRFVWWHSG